MLEFRSINNGIKISGIVHKIGTASKMLRSKSGPFIEKFTKEAWEEATTNGEEIRLLVNHDNKQSYATTKNGTLSVWIEDNDVRMDATIYDGPLAEDIRAYGDGFSFGFNMKDEKWEDADGYSIRSIAKAAISEISVLINNRPAYGGTLVEVRSAEEGNDYIELPETNLLSEVRSMDYNSDEFKVFADKLFDIFKEKMNDNTEETHKEEVTDTKVEETTEEVVEDVIDEDTQGNVAIDIPKMELNIDYELLANMITEKLKPVEQSQETEEATDTTEVVEETIEVTEEVHTQEETKEEDVQTPIVDEEVQKFLESLQNQKEVIEDEA